MKISSAVRRRIFETAACIIANHDEKFSCLAIDLAIPRVLKRKQDSARCRAVKHTLITEYAAIFKPRHIPLGWAWWDDGIDGSCNTNRQCRITALLLMAELQ